MSKIKSEEELKESERILRKFLMDLEDQTRHDPNSRGKKRDFNNNLVSVPSSIKQEDPRTGSFAHIVTKAQIPLFYKVVSSDEDLENGSLKSDNNVSNLEDYKICTISKPYDEWSNFEPFAVKNSYTCCDNKSYSETSSSSLSSETSSEKSTSEKSTSEKDSSEKFSSPKSQNSSDKSKTTFHSFCDQLSNNSELSMCEEEELGEPNVCSMKCKAGLEKQMKSIPPKTPSEIEIENTIQTLFEKYDVNKICKDIKRIQKKNTKKENIQKKAEVCENKCRKAEEKQRKKGGFDVFPQGFYIFEVLFNSNLEY